MYSVLRPGVVYKNISEDVVEQDDDMEVYPWEYDGRDVYRGSFDPHYMKYNLNVYSLYDENLKRVGIVEHDADELEIYEVLWFYDNPFARFYQNPEWKSSGRTLWSMLSSEAYQDCLEDDFKTVVERCLSSKYRLITVDMLFKQPTVYSCSACGKQSLSPLKKCKSVTESPYFSSKNYLYVDDSFILYNPPSDHPLPSSSSSEPEPQELEQAEPSAQEASTDAESPQHDPPSHESPLPTP